jgi:hypothetical protein
MTVITHLASPEILRTVFCRLDHEGLPYYFTVEHNADTFFLSLVVDGEVQPIRISLNYDEGYEVHADLKLGGSS